MTKEQQQYIVLKNAHALVYQIKGDGYLLLLLFSKGSHEHSLLKRKKNETKQN
jgi:hypothetical protein